MGNIGGKRQRMEKETENVTHEVETIEGREIRKKKNKVPRNRKKIENVEKRKRVGIIEKIIKKNQGRTSSEMRTIRDEN